ncbi:hypothetical protein F8M41_024601 [Gigaspora margarita]|uniref:Uncharacterized protein n=1 Tax=Gigaspora margarita TaxID=4874 RepID=A0A8H3XMP2_GIGMA|nr:hypothetical protein F8M41_024601 [Gigaspora margarita]
MVARICHKNCPELDNQASVVYGLHMYEPTDDSLYLIASDIQGSRYHSQPISLENTTSEQIITYDNVNGSFYIVNIILNDYIKNWIESSVMKRNDSSYEFIAKTGLQLKQIVALYELIEEHVADRVVNC